MELPYLSPSPHTVYIEKNRAGVWEAIVNGQRFTLRPSPRPGEMLLSTDDATTAPLVAYVASDGPRRLVWVNGETYELRVPEPKKKGNRARAGGADHLEAQMPGLVRQVLAQVGDTVERGQTLLLMEAMKMEIKIAAPHAGVVEKVLVKPGQAVERGQALLDVREA
jgi:biotin carboxyl carrier protein